MAVLKNPKHEIFAQELAKGSTQAKAYLAAGYKANDGNANKLASNPKVQERVRKITGKAAEKAGVTVERIMRELSKLGFSNMDDYVTVGADGLPFVDFSRLDRDQKAAIQEVHIDTTTSSEINESGEREAVPVRKVRFKLADKRSALVDMGKHLGMFTEKIEHTGKDGGAIETTGDNRGLALAILAILREAKVN